MILLLDNYDSFVFNLARYCERLGHETHVVRSDALDAGGVERLRPAAVVISPGPCTPNEAGCSLDVIRQLHSRLPLLGVCLGHQAIAAALGGRVVRAPQPMHGRAAQIFHRGQNVFAGLPNPLSACRYHSLAVEESSLPAALEVTAWSADGVVMALAHRSLPVIGWQFHPESILTDCGYELLANFLRLAGLAVAEPLPTIASERPRVDTAAQLPTQPVTF